MARQFQEVVEGWARELGEGLAPPLLGAELGHTG